MRGGERRCCLCCFVWLCGAVGVVLLGGGRWDGREWDVRRARLFVWRPFFFFVLLLSKPILAELVTWCSILLR